MITIKTLEKEQAELTVEKGTDSITIFLGIQMLIDCLMQQETGLTIDVLLNDLKTIYLRDIDNNSDRLEKEGKE